MVKAVSLCNSFIENVDFWDECSRYVRLSNNISEQLVYYFIKDSLLDKPFFIKSKSVKFSDTFVTIVKVNLDYYVVRRDDDYKIRIDKIVPSYRKRCRILVENLDKIYKKPEDTFVSFLQNYNVIPVFKE
jgi:hypothetical protein